MRGSDRVSRGNAKARAKHGRSTGARVQVFAPAIRRRPSRVNAHRNLRHGPVQRDLHTVHRDASVYDGMVLRDDGGMDHRLPEDRGNLRVRDSIDTWMEIAKVRDGDKGVTCRPNAEVETKAHRAPEVAETEPRTNACT